MGHKIKTQFLQKVKTTERQAVVQLCFVKLNLETE